MNLDSALLTVIAELRLRVETLDGQLQAALIDAAELRGRLPDTERETADG